MSKSVLQRQNELPRSIQLFRYVPSRVGFEWTHWDPAKVQGAHDLPPYLILGELDAESFERSAMGWSARWQGKETDTHLDVQYEAAARRYDLRQTWRGVDGGYSSCNARAPLDKLIAQMLYLQFPDTWEQAAKKELEDLYQITVIEQPKGAYGFCGLPDGAFRTVALPVAISDLRLARDWLRDAVAEANISYPIFAEAKLLFQAINYIEGKAPEWTTDQGVLFNQSMEETGLVPQGLPVKETASDGSSAWTLRREIYVVFIGLPFAGLTDFLRRVATSDGPIRSRSDQPIRIELQPIVMPAALEIQVQDVAFWDREHTTRSFWRFPKDAESAIPTIVDTPNGGAMAEEFLRSAETISADVTNAVRAIANKALDGRPQ